MRGIILAGGTGSRLYPITVSVSKQLLPVYDQPMIFYPIGTLVSAGVEEILIITTVEDRQAFERLLGDGKKWGVSFRFATQRQPGGIAQALLIAQEFIGLENFVLILGDNVFLTDLPSNRIARLKEANGATIFAHKVPNPSAYGVVEVDESGRPISIQEKPKFPRSELAIAGLYKFDARAIRIARELRPSKRGELEITEVQEKYLSWGELEVVELVGDKVWFDAGTFEGLFQASAEARKMRARASATEH